MSAQNSSTANGLGVAVTGATSDKASYLTGAIVAADGGRTAI